MNSFQDIPLAALLPSPTNPRKDFESPEMVAYLADLASTIRQRGVLQPVLARPGYCVGAATRSDIERLRVPSTLFQLVAGECRWRASKLAGCATLPAIVQEMTDDDAREAQQIENLQRRNLSPIEEAKGLEEMLELRDDAGRPRYTVEALAEKLGHKPDWVKKRRALLLLPVPAQEALAKGVLAPTVARLISALPDPQDRERFAAAIIRPKLSAEPLSYAAALALRDAEYVVPIKGVAFNPADAALVPAAGSCFDCPKYVGNRSDMIDADDLKAGIKVGRCYDPRCYRAKVDAHAAAKAKPSPAAQKRVLSAEAAAKIYPITVADGEMAPDSPYAQLTRRPAAYLLKPEVGAVPTWEELVQQAEEKLGGAVERVLIPDQKGVVREHVDVKLAIAAIEKSGEPIFRGRDSKAPAGGADLYTQQRTAEAERVRTQAEYLRRALDLVFAELARQQWWERPELRDFMQQLAELHAGPNGLLVLAKWQSLHVDAGAFGPSDAVKKWADGLDSAGQAAVMLLLLLTPALKMHGMESGDLQELARLLGVDLAKAKAAPVAAAAERKGGKKPKAKRPASAPVRAPKATREEKIAKARAMRAERKNFAEIYMATKLPRKFLTSLLAEIDGTRAK